MTYNNNIYCIGDYARETSYYSQLTYTNINNDGTLGAWSTPAALPFLAESISGPCTIYEGYMYCMASYNTAYSKFYSAPISGSGTIGTFTQTTNFPTTMTNGACLSSNGYITCIGYEVTCGAVNCAYSNVAYYAPISGGNIGSWQSTSTLASPYSCLQSNNYAYCLAGESSDYNNYYASLNNGALGSWRATTYAATGTYGEGILPQCSISSGYVYCADAALSSSSQTDVNEYATVSGSGIGQWQQIGDIPSGSCGIAVTSQQYSQSP